MIPVYQLLAVAGFEPRTLVVERRAVPTTTDLYGQPEVASPSLLNVEFIFHQTSRKQIVREELDQSRDWRSFYTRTRLLTGDNTSDIIRADGERWEVKEVGDYERIGGMFLVRAQRIE